MNTAEIRGARHWETLTIVLFLSMLFIPTIITLLLPDEETSSLEKRNLQLFPAYTNQPIETFTSSLNAYFDDQFVLRQPLVRVNASIEYFLLNQVPNENITLGTNGWLYYFVRQAGMMEDFQGRSRHSQVALENWRTRLEAVRDRLAEQGIRYVLVIAPEKQSVYPEFVPPAYEVVGETSPRQLVNYLRANSDLEVIDLQEVLLQRRAVDEQVLYYGYDTHWNPYGAYYSYQAILNHLQPDVAPPMSLDRLVAHFSPGEFSDLTLVNGLGGQLMEPRFDLLPENSCATLTERTRRQNSVGTDGRIHIYHCPEAEGNLLIFHDSFGAFFRVMLPETFEQTVFYDAQIRKLPDGELDRLVTLYQPDIVIEEIVERNFIARGN